MTDIKKIILLVFLTLSAGLTDCTENKKLVSSDDFEADSLNPVWRTDKFLPGALHLQSDIVRSGNKACKLTLHPGDQIDEEKGTQFERAELREPKDHMAREGNEYAYSFSLFLPDDFPIVKTRLVIAQWKQNCQSGNCDPDNPVVAVRFDSGVLRITLQTGTERLTLYENQQDITGHWLDFDFRIRFSRENNGRINVRLNEADVVDYKGITAYSNIHGYPYPGSFYFKTGLYRDSMDQTMTIYIDDYRKEEYGNPDQNNKVL